MKRFQFDPDDKTPIISAVLTGRKGARRVSLVFDTGAVITQIHAPIFSRIGYDTSLRVGPATMVGASGERHEGSLFQIQKLITLGTKVENIVVGAFDFSKLAESGIDGLLGWDVIKQLRLEMDGPAGVLKVF